MFTTMPHIDDGDGDTEWITKGQNAKEKVFNTPGYPARTPKPRPDLYEVRSTPDMGQGVFAKRNIKCGELIFSERPLLVAPTWLGGGTRTGDVARKFAKYTPDQVRQVLIFEFEKVLDTAVQRMGEKGKASFMSLFNSHTADGSGPLFGIMRTNSFGCNELSDDGPFIYGGVCNIASRINHRYVPISHMNCKASYAVHSCMPNVNVKFKATSFSFQFSAVRNIKAGEQLFCSYCGLDRTKAERQTDLAPYGFSCSCPACINATPGTDNLRKIFTEQVTRLRAWTSVMNKEWGDDILPSALLLESEMVAEGLESEVSFFNLLFVIFVSVKRLGRRAEEARYKKRLEEHYYLLYNDKPFQTWLSDGAVDS